jgi:hypothetical protein
MTHDPLCEFNFVLREVADCQRCTLIARVREDERGKGDLGLIEWGAERGYDDGYASALLDAVVAVYRTCGDTKCEGISPCAHDDAVAAIDGLTESHAAASSLPTCTRCGDTGWTGRANDPQSCECGRRS